MPVYPPMGFHFKVEFLNSSGAPKFSETSFQEVSGLNVEIGTEELSEGGVIYTHRLPGKIKFGNLILKRGLVTDSSLIDWIAAAVENYSFEPVTVSVSLLNLKHEAMMSWFFYRAWPVKWTTSDFKAQDSSIVIESFELAYERYTRRKPNS